MNTDMNGCRSLGGSSGSPSLAGVAFQALAAIRMNIPHENIELHKRNR